MIHHAVAWLPDTALTDVRTLDPVARGLSGWSDDWLQGQGLSVPARWERTGGTFSGAGYEALGDGDGYRLSMRLEGELELASALLGRDIDERGLRTKGDHLLIRKLADAAIDDLARRVRQLLGAGDSGASGELDFALPVSCFDPVPLFRLEASRGLLAGLARQWAGAARPAPDPDDWRASLGDQPVRLSALAGTSRLRLAEVESIGIGDVLTLDTPVDKALGACIDHRLGADGALTLVPGKDTLMLQIERPPLQW